MTPVVTRPADDGIQDVVTHVNQLDARYPFVLFPVRVESCFRLGGVGPAPVPPELLVRVYPDEILAYSHQPALTADEERAGQTYWNAVRDGASELDAWRALLARYEAPRAAWIVRATTPRGMPSAVGPFPSSGTHATSPGVWAGATEARLLPDAWLAIAYRTGAEVARMVSGPVQGPLALTLDPSVDPAADPASVTDVSGDGLLLDTALLWTIDFARAEDVGMALRIPLQPDDVAKGFDRLVVLGVLTSLTVQQGSTQLAELLDGHHYTRGLALVQQGDPTNSTSAAPSGFPPDDGDGSYSFAVERGAALTAPGRDGARFALAFGVPAAVADHVAGADRTEYQAARAMADALWPATLGYFLDQIMAPVFDQAAIGAARRHVVDYVVGRGPFAAFRVEATPYATLPVSSLARWQPRTGATGVDERLPPELVTLRRLWEQQAPKVPRVGSTSDPDADLLVVLGMDASAREARVRNAMGRDLQWNLASFLGVDWSQWSRGQRVAGERALALIGHPDWEPRVLGMTFDRDAPPLGVPFVTDAPLSESDPLDFDYVHWVRTASIADLKAEAFPPTLTKPTALLYTLLRQATLLEYRRVAFDLFIQYGLATEDDRREAELIGVVDGTEARPTVWDWFARPIPALTGQVPVGDYLFLSQSASGAGSPGTADITAYQASLTALEGLPTAELHRLVTETLDVHAYRLDAYITSLPAKRLDEMRQAQPEGSYVGAYGWVEDLRPLPAGTYREVRLPDGRQARVAANGGGYVQAPSVGHAAAAAILRNAYLSRTGDDRARYAIDLSSERVRAARQLLAAVRAGLSLPAVLGYGVERGLHDAQLDQYIEPLRQLYPLAAAAPAGANGAGGPTESIAPRNFVDGLALRTAFHDDKVSWGDGGLPAGGGDRAGIEAQLARLDAAVDATTDLLTAESMYQLVRGSTTAAAATLDAMAQGVRPPDPEIARQTRGGTTLTHRVAIVLGAPPVPDTAGWPVVREPGAAQPTHPSAEAEPHLDGWVGTVLGDPRAVRCRASYLDSTPADPARRTVREVTLDELALRPIEALRLAQSASLAGQASELDLRVAYVALGDAPEVTDVRIDYARDGTNWDRATVKTFPEVLELAQAVQGMLGAARALRPEDLLPPEVQSSQTPADRLAAAALARATDAEDALQAASRALDGAVSDVTNAAGGPTLAEVDSLRDAILGAAAFGVTGAIPATRKGVAAPAVGALLAQAVRVAAEVARRLAQAAAVAVPPASDVPGTLKAAGDKTHAVFGDDLFLLPGFIPGDPAVLDAALAAGPGLGASASDVQKWMQQAARVRPALQRWRTLGLLAVALRDPGAAYDTAQYDLAQLPTAPGERWVALKFASERQRPPAGRLSLVLHRPATPAATGQWAGLLLDEWTEVIPGAAETTGLAFQYDDLGAEAPQAVLIAVPPADPADKPNWDVMALVDTVNETLDLAQLRGVDGELLGAISQLLPRVYLASNVSDDTISTDFSDDTVTDPTIVVEGQSDGTDVGTGGKNQGEGNGRKYQRGEES